MTTPNIGLALQAPGSINWHTPIEDNWDIIDLAVGLSGAGDPNTVVAGDFVGQQYYDTTNDDIYICTTPGVPASAVWLPLKNNANFWTKTQAGIWSTKTATPINIDLADEQAIYIDMTAIGGAITVNFPVWDGGAFPAGLDVDFKIFIKNDVLPFTVTWVNGAGAWKWARGVEGFLSGAGNLDAFGFFVDPAGDILGAPLNDFS